MKTEVFCDFCCRRESPVARLFSTNFAAAYRQLSTTENWKIVVALMEVMISMGFVLRTIMAVLVGGPEPDAGETWVNQNISLKSVGNGSVP